MQKDSASIRYICLIYVANASIAIRSLTSEMKPHNFQPFSYFGGKILPNSYQFLENCQNSDDFRKIRPRYAQCRVTE